MDNVKNLINKITIINNNIEMYRLEKGVDQTMKEMGREFDDLCEELAKTGDSRGLLYLLDYFDDDFDLNNEGVLECIQNDIFDSFTFEQILDAFYKKFNQLVDRNQSRAENFSASFFYEEGYFEKFRKMFNAVKPKNARAFLDGLDNWLDDDYAVSHEGIEILREDMKKW